MPEDTPQYITRAMPFHLERAAKEGNGLTLEGYAAVFDVPTRIDSWEGCFDEVIARGAFASACSGEDYPVLQFDHGTHPMVGSIPIGMIDVLREDDHGLYVKATLHDNWLVQPVRDAIRSGAVDGMSFRFRVISETVDNTGDVPLRTLISVECPELGPVVFPAYDDTIVGVRSQHVAAVIADPEALNLLARALYVSNPTGEPPMQGGSGDVVTNEPAARTGMSPNERARVLALIPKES